MNFGKYTYYQNIPLQMDPNGVLSLEVTLSLVGIAGIYSTHCLKVPSALEFELMSSITVKPKAETSVFFKSNLPLDDINIIPSLMILEATGAYHVALKQDPVDRNILEMVLTLKLEESTPISVTLDIANGISKNYNLLPSLSYWVPGTIFTNPGPGTLLGQGDYFRPVIRLQAPGLKNIAALSTHPLISYQPYDNQFIMYPANTYYDQAQIISPYSGSASLGYSYTMNRDGSMLSMGAKTNVIRTDPRNPALSHLYVIVQFSRFWNPKINLSFYFDFYSKPNFIHPLYGLVLSDGDGNFRYELMVRLPPYRTTYSVTFSTDYNGPLSTTFSVTPPTIAVTPDSIPPIVEDFKVKSLNNGKGQGVVTLRISDNYSGFARLQYGIGPLFTIDSTDLISGSFLDGYYQKVISLSDLYPVSFTICDRAGSIMTQSSVYNPKGLEIEFQVNYLV
ncbi:hypothetical protein CYY_004027 [Polysphondylium violaceum]|uniref:DUF7743 domain-containing protein n=1 Tax=Polysphondylium violaceum TaxID=133409 RepID=A0A8J4PVW7_9MYCE|nr:hypothetical protein CYY_004027 [Polysphondylium violaceum]